MSYYAKYLKYKNKYLSLSGGARLVHTVVDLVDHCATLELQKNRITHTHKDNIEKKPLIDKINKLYENYKNKIVNKELTQEQTNINTLYTIGSRIKDLYDSIDATITVNTKYTVKIEENIKEIEFLFSTLILV